jgi:hypothetical protein
MRGLAKLIRSAPTLALMLVALDACSDSSPVAVASNRPCGSAGVVTLNALQAVTIDCSAGSVIQLAGAGARYLIVPEFATGNVTKRATSYVLSDSDALPVTASEILAKRVPNSSASFAGRLGTRIGPGMRQVRYDAALRARERQAFSDGRWKAQGAGAQTASARAAMVAQSVAAPSAGSIRAFRVVNTFNTQNVTYATVNAKLQFIGANTLVYLDTLSPPNGFTPAQLISFGQTIDQTFFTLDVDAFGPPSDIDGNGKVIVLLTPVVNALSPASECQTQGYIAGFFDGFDLSGSDSNSNRGEIYYGLVPDANGTRSCAHSVASVSSIAPGTFLHELQHMISYSQHVIVHNGSPEEGWLDEGLSIFAQELGSQYYERKFPPPTGRTNPNQLLPDSAEGFIADEFSESFSYLEKPDTTTLTLHSDADGGLTWRAGDWLLAHWLGDQEGSSFYRRLDENTLTGTANIAAVAGEPFQSLFGDFGLAMWTDSIPGVPKSAIPQRDKFTTRTLRTIFQAVFNAGGAGSAGPFPITLQTLSGQTTASMVPGTVSYYELVTSATVPATTLRFTAPGGGAIATSLHPQVSIFRLQ